MAYNKVINAVIALVENRLSDAKEMLRSPELEIPAGAVISRLDRSLRVVQNKAKVNALKTVLRHTLSINSKSQGYKTKELEDAFTLGVIYVEEHVEALIRIIMEQIEYDEQSSKVEIPPGLSAES